MFYSNVFRSKNRAALILLLTCLPLGAVAPAHAQVSSFMQSVAEAAAVDQVVAEFYRSRNYETLWIGAQDADRRSALLTAFDGASLHGLPSARYDAMALRAGFAAAQTEGDLGRLEVAMTEAFLTYAHDMKSGVLTPKEVDSGILREIISPDPATLLAAIAQDDPRAFLRSLPPKSPQYARLMKEKLRLEAEIASGNRALPLSVNKLEPGASGSAVVAMRDRLTELGYLQRSISSTYDRQIVSAVQRFQLDQGLNADGVAGPSTVEALNLTSRDRLKAVEVAMERLRWLGDAPLGDRHIWVNLPEFTAKVVDKGRVTFQTRTVIGKAVADQRSPEFSDEMEYMVVNPSWGVPRSILVKEYLPLLRSNPHAVSHLQVVDNRGRVVPRGAVNFAAYSASNFPFGLRQPPSDGNALGKVKFMFPNPYNIYLHDTPTKSLFANEVRAYSHGCIRLGDPMDLAYTLLARQSDDPRAEFKRDLDTNRETNVTFQQKIPVHLVYFTAWPTEGGAIGYRRDVYGRDGRIYDALIKAGVVLDGVKG
ncbi:MAG: L,D-transpeptidase family protein [Cypionkella sp.]